MRPLLRLPLASPIRPVDVPSRTHRRADVPDFDRLSTIRFPLALSLLFLHNDRTGDFSGRLQDSPALAELVHQLSVGLGGIRLPTFFLIAGFLFFRACAPTAAWFGAKIVARARSLLLPLIAWNLLGLLVLGAAQQVPPLASLLNAGSGWQTPIAEFTLAQFFSALVGGLRSQPLVYPLWFLHDLFILVLLTPLIHGLIVASRGAVSVAVAAFWLGGSSVPLVSHDAFFFFFVGYHVALAGKSLFSLDALGGAAAIGWLALACVADGDTVMPPFGHALRSVLGVIAVLALSGVLARRERFVRWAKRAEPYGIFLFFAHEPLLTVTRKAAFKLLQIQSPVAVVIAYFCVIAVVVGVLAGVFMLMRRLAPGALGVMTGGRSGKSAEQRARLRGRQPA